MLKEEKLFVDHFVDNFYIDGFFGDEYIVLREFKSDSGIPDVLLVNSVDYSSLIEFLRSYPELDICISHAKVILCLNKKSYQNLLMLENSTGYSASYLKSILNELACSGITNTNEKGWKLSTNFSFPEVETISLEFKLHDWKSALRQAFRYKRISQKSWVIMPSSKLILLRRNKIRFQKLGIGLMTYSMETKKVVAITRPRRSKPRNSSHFGSLAELYRSVTAA